MLDIRRLVMFLRNLSVAVLIGCLVSPALADEVLYRYEGDVFPYDPSGGWAVYDPCEDPCSESLQDGYFVLQWPQNCAKLLIVD